MTGFKKFQNVPLKIIPKEDRVKNGELGICQGGCNRLSKINNNTYQLCRTCISKWRYHGYACDVPNCESESDGTIAFHPIKNKMICRNCRSKWKRMDLCVWERFVEERHLYFLRPKTFVKALEEGIISSVKKENRVNPYEMADCHHCYRVIKIKNPTYQLCDNCEKHLQFHGHTCGVCKVNDAYGFDTPESIFTCKACQATKNKYKIASYHIYKTQIRIINNCHICKEAISHNTEGGKPRSANIDHDHDTDITRGVLCLTCNAIEGMVKTLDISPYAYATRLKSYLENPPLSQSWTQDFS